MTNNSFSVTNTPCVAYHSAKLEFLCIDPKAKKPHRANHDDAGADLFSVEDLELAPGESALVNTGIGIKVPKGYVGEVHNRSSQRVKGITSLGVGIIDAGYRGPIKVFLVNQGNDLYKIVAGETKIAQLLIKRVELVDFVDIWNDSARGTGGFGSTG